MAAFTTLALIGLAGALAGSTIAARRANSRARRNATQDALTDTTGANENVPAPPPSTAEAGSAGVQMARTAAERQRKRASAGSSLLTGGPVSKIKAPTASLAPKSLLGY